MAVQISGNDITVPRDGSFTRNVTIGGTLTYEDVTNIDSVGLVTARNGIEIGARPGVAASISVDGNMIVSGISTFGGALSGTTGTFSGAVQTVGFTNTIASGNVIALMDSSNASQNHRVRINSQGASSSTSLVISNSNANNQTSLVHGNDGVFSIRNGQTAGSEPTSGTERLRITSGGKFGFGTDSPYTYGIATFSSSNGIVLEGSSQGRLLFRHTGGGTNLKMFDLASSDGVMKFRTIADNGTTVTERLRIDSSGHVMIGTTTEGFATYGDQFTIANSGHCGMTIRSGTSNYGTIYFSDGDDGSSDEVRGFIDYNHTTNQLQLGTNAATRLRISSAGHVTKPYHTCFGATGNQGTYSVAAGQVFAFNTYHQSYPNSRNAGYDTSTYKFTAPVAGVYSFTVNLYFRDVNLSNLFSLVPRINGSEVQGGAGDKMFFFSCQNIHYDTTISGTVYLNLDANDYVEVARRTGQTGSHSFYMPHSSFFGHLIG